MAKNPNGNKKINTIADGQGSPEGVVKSAGKSREGKRRSTIKGKGF